MSDKGTIEQLHAELVQAREELVQAQTEIARVDKISDGYATGWADTCAARDALARRCDSLNSKLTDKRGKLVQAQRQLATTVARLSASKGRTKELYGMVTDRNRKLTQALNERDEAEAELAQAREELAQSQERVFWLNPAGETELRRQLAAMKENRNFWFEKCHEAEAERHNIRKAAQAQSDEVQHHWLSPCQKAGLESLVETLRRQLKQARDELATADFAELRRVHKSEHLEAEGLRLQLSEAELAAHVHSKARDELAQTVRTEQARLRDMKRCAKQAEAELKRAHQTLYHLGVPSDGENGKLSITERIERLARHERTRRATRAEAELEEMRMEHAIWEKHSLVAIVTERDELRIELAAVDGAAVSKLRLCLQDTEVALQEERQLRQEAELVAHVHDKACGELAQTVQTERALRQEAEEGIVEMKIALGKALNATKTPGAWPEGKIMTITERIFWLNSKLQFTEAELSNGHKSLTAAGVSQTYNSGEPIKIASRIVRLRQHAMATNKALAASRKRANKAVNQLSRDGERAERAEALAASIREAVEWLWGFFDGNTLVARPGYEDDIREAWDKLLAATDGAETVSLLDRLERAEALAALVNEETARLLTQLASNTRLLTSRSDRSEIGRADCWRKDAQAGHVLAAQIRRALDD